MPYSSPSKVPSNVPADKKKQFMEVFNSVYSDTKDEGRAMAAAYSAIKKGMSVGSKVSWNSSGGTARGIIREIVRDGKVSGIPVKVTGTEEEPAARIEIVDDEGKPTGEMVGHKLSTLRKFEVTKAQYANDIFTTPQEAVSRSFDLGLYGAIHVTDYDEQAVYMPGASEDAYIAYYEALAGIPPEEEEEPSYDRIEALRAIVQEVLKQDLQKAQYRGKEVTLNKPRRLRGGKKKFEVFVMDGDKVKRVTFGDPNMEIRRDDPKARANFRSRHSCDTATDKTSPRYWSCRMWEADTSVSDMTKQFEAYGEVTKIDSEQRIVYGFACVVSKNGEMIVDRQGDVITTDEMEKAATQFMLGARNGLTMHKGEPTTTIVHSLPLTKQIMDAFGISSDKEGWLIAVKVHDDDTWDRMKKGEFTGFSIGGRARKVQLDD